jgi:spore germination protein YaaH
MFGKFSKVLIATMVIALLAGCASNGAVVGSANAPSRAAWITYWDLESGEKDLNLISRKLGQLIYFAAYFDESGHLFVPAGLSEKKALIEKNKNNYETYLSFVNDKLNANGAPLLKDLDILRRWFADDISIEKHVDEIIALTLKGGYDGIEIDYERLWEEDDIGLPFLRFTAKLYQKSTQNNLKVRIVFEPGTPFSRLKFFDGPEYVVMFYNLHGTHNEPGPKADKNFIRDTIKQMKYLPDKKSVAISTGGCLWGSNGHSEFITETDARLLAQKYKAKTRRDKDSQCMVFSYKDNGVSYVVWYADVNTLNYWISLARNQGQNNISIWSLGGNLDFNKIN